MKIRPLGAELFRADRQTDKHVAANSFSSQVCERAEKRQEDPKWSGKRKWESDEAEDSNT